MHQGFVQNKCSSNMVYYSNISNIVSHKLQTVKWIMVEEFDQFPGCKCDTLPHTMLFNFFYAENKDWMALRCG